MSFEWDEVKAEKNLRDHGVDFADAATVLEDDLALTISDDTPGEERFVTLGLDALGRHLVVVYTWREDRVRIISARKASKTERRRYEEGV
ncbi:MAG: BrnT family toxin [Candidatus Latescibacteria bacterium]|nr:BrnT family toxin [Candidatus Latescibacterota bacterium]NIO78762.1 BrnT family toxin [Candidatus Latescibacterota bacterium]